MTSKRWIGSVAAVFFLLSAGIAAAQNTPGTTPTNLQPVTDAERQFILEAASGGDREVQLGDLAREKAQNNAVKQFGTRMVQDHTKAGQELRRLAVSHGVKLNQAPAPGSSTEQPSIEYLAKIDRKVFDKEYVDAMVKDHEKDVADFRRMAQQTQDPDLKSWVTRTLPTLEDHLRTIRSIQGNITAAR